MKGTRTLARHFVIVSFIFWKLCFAANVMFIKLENRCIFAAPCQSSSTVHKRGGKSRKLLVAGRTCAGRCKCSFRWHYASSFLSSHTIFYLSHFYFWKLGFAAGAVFIMLRNGCISAAPCQSPTVARNKGKISRHLLVAGLGVCGCKCAFRLHCIASRRWCKKREAVHSYFARPRHWKLAMHNLLHPINVEHY